mmetsp:Transcript_1569/g.4006  ORF Transcript_1569/g.4006 Transcript_1569/m.4006 type:complete len:694 (-) Transcript_1569:69-2150(-)
MSAARSDASGSSRSLDRGESQPLLGIPTERRTGFLEHKESIYHFLVIYPELHRVKRGSYYDAKVGIAFALIVLNIVLQVSLTMIAGSSIFDDMTSYKSSLTQEPGSATSRYLRERAEELAEEVADRAADKFDRFADKYTAHSGLRLQYNESTKAAACCAADECIGQAPCCHSKRGLGDQSKLLQTRGGQARKPAGSSKAKGKKEVGEGTERRALCLNSQDGLDCAPPTYDYVNHWDELDVNKDGVWTKEEAEADELNLGCKLGVPSEEVFRAVISGLRKYAMEISKDLDTLAPEVTSGWGVPRKYFEHWRGMVVMCAAVDHNRCTGLIEEGVFDGALKMAVEDHAPRDGIKSLEYALDYCQTMLFPGGVCDKALPVMYIMYRQQVRDKCGSPTYLTGSVYHNPYDEGDVLRVVELSYPKLDKYTMAESPVFQFFLCLILLVWYVNLLGEFVSILRLADFAWNFPGAQDDDPLLLRKLGRRVKRVVSHTASNFRQRMSFSDRDGRPEDEEAPRRQGSKSPAWTPRYVEVESPIIQDISEVHRAICFLIVSLRLWLLLYMANVGTVFTLSTYSYPDLLMNAVALAFVFELPEFLFALLVKAEDKRALEEVGALEYCSLIPKPVGVMAYLCSVYFWGLVVFPAVCVTEVYLHHVYTVLPIYEALNCACLQHGERCIAQQTLTRSWWDRQWAGLEPL